MCWTTEQQQQVDEAFITHSVDARPSAALATLVVTASVYAVKGVALDESGRDEEEEAAELRKTKILDEQIPRD
jgi:hypothetical protein